ncbi:MAG: hypothetical protein UX13_C0003G0014 [Candidatus Woesebacteria bacterium GW2011_GWB1_45_5]|uniref:Uncharacterized protein n=1 Tax=Candidatus Woesebacteria bacterium GW2011_GWB1_45_5 TaxID=1618581 RepID=A0A0G1MRP2_9BACT|nr:MAG: hypothetical protein UX13_C0003G0014 [Candidatus Woesebacteria bacterium GW2011_GWB1_45_5]
MEKGYTKKELNKIKSVLEESAKQYRINLEYRKAVNKLLNDVILNDVKIKKR